MNCAGTSLRAEVGPDQRLDLNRCLTAHPGATFYLEILKTCHSKLVAGDVVVVDRALEPTSDSMVIAALNGDLVLGTFSTLTDLETLWGVVTHVIHSL